MQCECILEYGLLLERIKEELHLKLKLSMFCALSQNYRHFKQNITSS